MAVNLFERDNLLLGTKRIGINWADWAAPSDWIRWTAWRYASQFFVRTVWFRAKAQFACFQRSGSGSPPSIVWERSTVSRWMPSRRYDTRRLSLQTAKSLLFAHFPQPISRGKFDGNRPMGRAQPWRATACSFRRG